ncbi:ferrochelatase [Neisseria sp. Ec49-e6-T10]|uniref:ferrochelatase n=1 Tax=Neisseria sp. Ec49-e6-T10 TaxID=3140744 RepID=UPI003EB85019
MFQTEVYQPSYPPQHKIGVLLLNLGSPEQATAQAVKPYLKQFLSDKRVIELPSLLWQPILRGPILTFRPKESAQKYQRVWLKEGSPLTVYTQKQSTLLQTQFDPEKVIVDFAMSYGMPSVEHVMQKMKAQGVTQLLVFPLYPQYAGSSTAAALDGVFRVLMKQRNMLPVRTVTRFYDHPLYIQTIANNIRAFWQQHGKGDRLMMSFHGVPLQTIEKGDPYFDECHYSARLIAQALNLTEEDYIVSFQSRFGKAKWVEPSTQNLLVELPKKGITKLDVICPGFVSDCLETLEEIAIDGKELFTHAGGTQYHYIPCPNEQPEWVEVLKTITLKELQGWLEQ